LYDTQHVQVVGNSTLRLNWKYGLQSDLGGKRNTCIIFMNLKDGAVFFKWGRFYFILTHIWINLHGSPHHFKKKWLFIIYIQRIPWFECTSSSPPSCYVHRNFFFFFSKWLPKQTMHIPEFSSRMLTRGSNVCSNWR
jgi:hypothetical protein